MFHKFSAVKCKKAEKKKKIISDGGIKFSGDIIKAIAAGADAIMMGQYLLEQKKVRGKTFKLKNKLYKLYRGMGSIGAMSSGSSERYFQKIKKINLNLCRRSWERVLYKGEVSKDNISNARRAKVINGIYRCPHIERCN